MTLFARSDFEDKEELEGDPGSFERFAYQQQHDLAEYPQNYDPEDPGQELIEPIMVLITIRIDPTSIGEAKSFEHIGNKTAVKLLKKIIKAFKD
jgi:hypothetical protein